MVPISQYQSARCCSATMTFSELCSFPCIRFIYFTFVFVFGWSDPTKTLTWFTLTMYAKLNSCNTNQIWEICMFSRLHTQSMQSCHFEKKTLITGNGAFAMSLQKNVYLFGILVRFIPVFPVSVQKLDLVISSPPLYRERKDRNYLEGKLAVLLACVAWWFLSKLSALRQRGSRDNKPRSREEPGRERNDKNTASPLVSTKPKNRTAKLFR